MIKPNIDKAKYDHHQAGFTIIEVVLVLAIAGLIFLMVFIALPALQRNQRDTARRQDVGHVLSARSNYHSNNRNNFPTVKTGNSTTPGGNTWGSTGCRNYNYSNEFKPYYEDVLSSQTVTVCIIDQAHTGSDGGLSVGYSHSRVDSTIGLILKSKCDNENSRSRYTAGAVASAVVKLEGGGYFCQDI